MKTRSYHVGFATSILGVLGDHGKSARHFFHKSVVQRTMEPTGTRFEVEMFDGTENFGLWQTKVKILLAQQECLKALRDVKPDGR